jgi:hypothetical protein
LREATSAGVVPADLSGPENRSKREFQSSVFVRRLWIRTNAPVDFHKKLGQQSGHDIDSFDSAEGNLNRKLIRRTEVKGKGVP